MENKQINMSFAELFEAVDKISSGKFFTIDLEARRYEDGKREILYRLYHADLGFTPRAPTATVALALYRDMLAGRVGASAESVGNPAEVLR